MAAGGGTLTVGGDGDGAAAAAAARSLATGDLVDGVYRIERQLGLGGSGAVYLATHEALGGARFAIKVLHERSEGAAAALAREGRLAALVRSPHVVKVAGFGRLPGGAPYLVMEYVAGTTLEARLAAGELDVATALDCGRQLCLALEAAHGQGLIHGDVSLRNLFADLHPDGRLHLQLGDFGLVRRAPGDAAATVSVELGMARGTPRFMAPEVITGVDTVDQRADLFAAGVVLYRLLAGRYPFDGDGARAIFTAILRGDPAPVDARRPALRAIAPVVMRCLELAPAARFPDARALREALTAAEHARPGGRWLRRGAAGGGATLAIAGVAWLALAGRSPSTSIPAAKALGCPDAVGAAVAGDPEVAHAVAQGLCARLGAALDVDWGGGAGATTVRTAIDGTTTTGFTIVAAVGDRRITAVGPTPLAAVEAAAARLADRFAQPMPAAEIARWGARDAASARAARAVWRRRTTLLLDDYERAPRAVLADDPGSPFMHALLAEVERDAGQLAAARAAARAAADRLPPARAAAVRGFVDVLETPGAPEPGLAQLRDAYASAPDDVDVAVMYTAALVAAGRADTALAVVERVHGLAPGRALLAIHHADGLPTRTLGERGYLSRWILDALPELRGSSGMVYDLVYADRLDDARAALAFGARLDAPVPGDLPRAMLALAEGRPEEVPLDKLADGRSWSRTLAVRLRVATLLLEGRVTAAATFIDQAIGESQRDSEARAAEWIAELLRAGRRVELPAVSPERLRWLGDALARLDVPLSRRAWMRAELLVARQRAGVPAAELRAELAAAQAELEQRAGGDAEALQAARLRTLPAVRAIEGDDAAAALWREAANSFEYERVMTALDAALALDAAGDAAGAQAAYRLAASPSAIERRPLELLAARLRLIDRPAAGDDVARYAAFVDRVLASADPGVRERLRAAR